MPINDLKVLNIGNNSLLGLWEIKLTSEELLLLSKLSAIDLHIYNSFTAEKRKKEWLMVRILLAEMLPHQTKEILYDGSGRPYLADHSYNISVSHSHNYVAILLDVDHAVGIDIQFIKSTILKAPDYFLTVAEIECITEPGLIEKYHVYWCAKEALFKYAGDADLIIKTDVFIEPFEYEGSGIIKGRIVTGNQTQIIKLCYEKIGEYMLVYTIPASFKLCS